MAASGVYRRLRGFLAKRLVSNAVSLYAIQGLNYLMPLIVLPYLLRVLGAASYGRIVMAQSLMGYAMVITDFGFNLTAARDISIVRSDSVAISKIYWCTVGAKLLLLLGSLMALLAVVALVPSFRQDWAIFLASSLMVFGNAIFPQWYLQGLERLKDAALIQASTKIIGAVAIFAFVRRSSDLVTAAVVSAAPQLVAVFVAALFRRPLMPETFYLPTRGDVVRSLRSGWHMFASSVATSLYGNTTSFALGLIAGDRALALYSLANRLVLALQGIAMPLTQAVFPRASLLFSEQRDRAWVLMTQLVKFLLPMVGIGAALLALMAPTIVVLMGGQSFAAAAPLVRIMALNAVVIAAGALPAQIVIVATGRTQELSRIYLKVGLLNIALAPILIELYGATGAAVALTLAEVLATWQMIRLAARERGRTGDGALSTSVRD